MKRTGFKRPTIERKRTVHTPLPEAHRRQVSMQGCPDTGENIEGCRDDE